MLWDCGSRLSVVIPRTSNSLDLNTALREVVESIRALTSARFGGAATLGESGEVEEFVTSGITAAEHWGVVNWRDGLRLFENFRDLPASLRMRDMPGYLRTLGRSDGHCIAKHVATDPKSPVNTFSRAALFYRRTTANNSMAIDTDNWLAAHPRNGI